MGLGRVFGVDMKHSTVFQGVHIFLCTSRLSKGLKHLVLNGFEGGFVLLLRGTCQRSTWKNKVANLLGLRIISDIKTDSMKWTRLVLLALYKFVVKLSAEAVKTYPFGKV